VRNIERALEYYEGLFGFERVGEPVDVPHEGVRVCFVRVPPGTLIELVEGVTDDSPVRKLLEQPGAGAYHICYEVDDLDESIRALRKARCFPFKKFDSGRPGGRRFAFLLNPDRQLFELCETGAGERGGP